MFHPPWPPRLTTTLCRLSENCRLCALLIAAALPCPALAGRQTAEDGADIRRVVGIERIEVGLAGCYKPGLWTPVAVTLGGSELPGGEPSITVPDGDGVPSRVFLPDSGR